MSEGEKSIVFWLGVLILGSAVVALFWSVWFALMIARTPESGWRSFAPITFGSVVFLLIGLYMIRSALVKTNEAETG